MISKSSTRNIFAFALVLLCGHADAATKLNMNNLCLLMQNNALLASGDSCSSYYSCFNGVATLQNCPNGLYFNKNLQSCTPEAPSYCGGSNANPCLGHPIGSWVGVSGSCAGYYYCSASGAVRSNCVGGLLFDPVKQSCVYKQDYPCTDTATINTATNTAINLCSYVKNGIYFGNAFNCAAWQICNNDVNYSTGTCDNGLLYDASRNLCDYKQNVKCSQLSYDPNLDVTSPATGGACTTNAAVKAATACNQYYKCTGFTWLLTNCIGQLFYDTVSQQCISRMNAINNCDRCVSTVDQFVNAFGTNCTDYLVCNNGAKQSVGTCPKGYYFNEERGACTDPNPEFAFCVDATTSTNAPTTTESANTESATTVSATTEKAEPATTITPAANPPPAGGTTS